jgi:predicted lipoprotein with Yx(FWY)xxD motif
MLTVAVAAVAGFAVAVLASIAIAKTVTKDTIKTASNAKIGATLVVGANGMTLYELSPETSHHLLCTTQQCLQFWPPLKVKSAKAKLAKAPGIKGKLGILHRHGFFQVTLGGRPLYFFSGDKAKGNANGQGIPDAGGTWHVVKASGAPAGGGPTTSTSTTPPTTSTNPYY